MNEKKFNKQSGFTLVEIMLVVVIIGVLAGIAVPKIAGNVEKGRITKTKSNIGAISTAIDMYEMDVSKYPQQLEDLISGTAKGWDGPYFRDGKLPIDGWGNSFTFSVQGNTYTISSPGGRDGKEITNKTLND